MVLNQHMETTQIKTYLLGSLPADASLALEERLLTDDTFFELLQAEEDELIDEYLAHELSPTERQQFEQIFLAAPARRARLSWAQTLHQQLAQAAAAPHASATAASPVTSTPAIAPWWRAWLSAPLAYAAAALLIAAVGWGLWQFNPPAPTVATFTLAPIAVRANGPTNPVAVPPGATQIKLILELEKVESGPYQALLRDEAGQQQRWAGLQPLGQDKRQQLVLEIPAAQLAAGTYQIKLTATAAALPVEQYTFQVTR